MEPLSTLPNSIKPSSPPSAALALAGLVAALPGLVVLQALPRIVEMPQNPSALSVLGVMGVLLPLVGALLGGLLSAMLTDRGWEAGALVGPIAQLPALSGYLQIMTASLELGYIPDAAVYTVLLLSYLVLSFSLGANAAGWWHARQRGGIRDLPLFPSTLSFKVSIAWTLGAIVFLGCALFVLGNLGAPWFYAIFLGLAASALLVTVSRAGTKGWLQKAALVLLVVSLGVTGLAVALVVSLVVV